jgi:hypothetical protein
MNYRPDDSLSANMQFTLKDREDDFIYKPEKRIFNFYQICKFPKDTYYLVRKIKFDEYCEITNVEERSIKKNKLKKFLKKCPSNKYTIYPTYNFNNVGYPDPNEILTAHSLIMNNLVI